MCLIIANPTGKLIDFDILRNATNTNSDGFGVAFPANGKVKIKKYDHLGAEAQYRLLKSLQGVPSIIHWRWATHGKVCINLAHPFRVSRTCALVHNGVLNIKDIPDGHSDTSFMVAALREAGHLDRVTAADALDKMPDTIISGSKFALIDEEGEISIINEKAGDWEDGLWHSNQGGFSSYCYSGGYSSRKPIGRGYIYGDDWSVDDYYSSKPSNTTSGLTQMYPPKSAQESAKALLGNSYIEPEQDPDIIEAQKQGFYLEDTSDIDGRLLLDDEDAARKYLHEFLWEKEGLSLEELADSALKE